METLNLLAGMALLTLFVSGLALCWYLWVSVREVPQSIRLAITMGGQFVGIGGPGWTFVLRWIQEAKEVSIVSEPLQVFETTETIKFLDALAPVHLEAWVAPRPDRNGIYAVTFHWGNWREWAEGEIASRVRAVFAATTLADAQLMKGDILGVLAAAGNDIVAVLDAGGVVLSKLLLEDIAEPPDLVAATQAQKTAQLEAQAAVFDAQKQATFLANLHVGIKNALIASGVAVVDAEAQARSYVEQTIAANANENSALKRIYVQGLDAAVAAAMAALGRTP